MAFRKAEGIHLMKVKIILVETRRAELEFEVEDGTSKAAIVDIACVQADRGQHWFSAGRGLEVEHLSAEPDAISY